MKEFRYDGPVAVQDPQCTGNRYLGKLATAGLEQHAIVLEEPQGLVALPEA